MSYVYLLWEENTSFYKIGKANNPGARLAGLRVGSANDVVMVGKIVSGDALALESSLKSRFKKYHKRGEWFNIPPMDVLPLLLLFNHNPCYLMPSDCQDSSMDLSDFDARLVQANKKLQEMRVSKYSVRIERRGNTLGLQATLPPKPGVAGDKWFQQRVPLDVRPSTFGLEFAFKAGAKILADVSAGVFDWQEWISKEGLGEFKERGIQEVESLLASPKAGEQLGNTSRLKT
jgi:hypothetical protein